MRRIRGSDSSSQSPSRGRRVRRALAGAGAIWDIATSSVVAQFRHEASAERAAFAPAGDRLLTTSTDHHAVVWRLGLETASHATVAAFVRCHAPYQLVDGRLESRTPICMVD